MRRVTVALAAALSLAACTEKKSEPAPVPAEAVAVEAAPAATVIDVPAFTVSTDAADIKKGVTARRDETWIKKMILRPEVMVKEDPVAKKLLGELFVPMSNQNVNPQTELPFILAYLKSAEK